jgi:processive 1,2-diacylglycerol beta-glucosyltransferase
VVTVNITEVHLLTLRDSATGAALCRLSEEQLDLIRDQLEEEGPRDQDYYIDAATIDLLEDAGVESRVIDALRSALGERDGIDVRWDDL